MRANEGKKSEELYSHQTRMQFWAHWTGKFSHKSFLFLLAAKSFSVGKLSIKRNKFATSFCLLSFTTELKARVLGPTDLYVKSGSEITLTCKLQQGPHDLGTIYWYKGECNNCFCFFMLPTWHIYSLILQPFGCCLASDANDIA